MQVLGLGIGGLLLLDLLSALLAERFWFESIGYFSVFSKRLITQGLIGISVFLVSLGLLWRNLSIAQRQVWPSPEFEIERPQQPGSLSMVSLLPIVMGLGITLTISLLHYSRIAINHWQPNLNLRSTNLPVPLKFDHQAIWSLLQTWPTQPWQPPLVVGLTLLLLIYPHLTLRALTLLVSLIFVLVLSEHWDRLLLALNSMPFHATEPLLNTDVGFYIFTLPLWELLEFWLLGLATISFLSVGLTYLLSADSLSQGYFPGFSARQLRHLCWLGGWFVLMVACGYWIDRYKLLYDPSGAIYGAGYTGAVLQLPLYTLLSLMALPIAGWLLIRAMRFRVTPAPRRRLFLPSPTSMPGQLPSTRLPIGQRPGSTDLDLRLPSYRHYREAILTPSLPSSQSSSQASPILLTPLRWGLGAYLLITLLVGGLLPLIIQQFLVLPNELKLERPYIERTLALTRQAFDLDRIEVETFAPTNSLTQASLQANNLTIENIRLWDKRPLLETNRQLERIRLYYEFPDADIDRYSLPNDKGQMIQQQVLIAARELDYSAVPAAAQTWVNQHLVYTHGYGFTVSPVNRVAEGGLPDYLIRGIDSVEDPRIRSALPTGKPRIYFGELTNTYVMTQTRLEELDHPSGSDNIYNRYDGWDGVSLGNWGQRLLYAKHLNDWQMLFTDDFTPQTKLLFRRNINERVKTIAPFLRYDRDPYLVVADTGNRQWQHGGEHPTPQSGDAQSPDDSYLYWMIDAYTTTDRYPYSDPLGNDFNYIRNSVKVVVDAYHGAVTFYIADPQDPLIQAWSQIFPGMFRPLSEMPTVLRQHTRYPQDYLQVQSNQLMTYHMTDPIVFYNREDQWRAPNEIYGNAPQVVEPYYLIMKLPIASSEEFVLLRPFTPAQRNNLIAWLAARSDRDEYGKILLYTFPKQELVFGPEQIDARINQDPVISERISLWNRQGSRAAQGNLLVVPIEQSLLYIEPLYLVAEQNQLPTLARVIAAYGSRIAMAETLEGALNAIFSEAATAAPILRPAAPLETPER